MNRLLRLLPLAVLGALWAVLGAPVAPAAASAAPTAPAASSAAALTLVLPLAAHTAGLQRYATAVATPSSPLYRHFRSVAWLAAHFGASARTEAKVVTYLRTHGGSRVRVDHTGLFIDAELSPARAAALFGTRLVRRGSRAGATIAPASSVHIPTALAGAITGVVGLDTAPVLAAPALQRAKVTLASVLAPRTPSRVGPAFARASPAARSAFASLSEPVARPSVDPGSGYLSATGTMSGCASARSVGGFTPNQYLTAYNYGPLHSTGTLGQGERVALIEVDGFIKSDISAFAHCFGLHLPRIVAFRTDRSVSARGLAPGGEATLDLEVLDAAAPNLSQIDVYESSADIASALQAFTAPLQNPGYKPEVISASLGLCEPQVRAAVGLGGLRNTEGALAEAAASGISVLAATGDDGSADCVNSTSPSGLPLPELAVNFPASSPEVTAVGGTNLTLTSSNEILSQRVWNDDQVAPGSAGGGGLSIVFARPGYQTGVVARNRRALPDVSMLADIGPGYDVYCTARPECIDPSLGQTDPWQSVGGTSAATPLLAGGFALVDQLLREHKQQGLGLVNPLLYSLGANASTAAQVFSDVTVGSNDVGPFIRASHQPLGCCSAAPGFDTASGWGSVNLASFATAALTVEPTLVNVTQEVPRGQHVLAAGAILDHVGCSGRCQIGALARLRIPGTRTVTLRSGLYHLTRAGTKVIRISLPSRERAILRGALAHRRRVTALVSGAIIDPAGNIERSTPAVSLTITR